MSERNSDDHSTLKVDGSEPTSPAASVTSNTSRDNVQQVETGEGDRVRLVQIKDPILKFRSEHPNTPKANFLDVKTEELLGPVVFIDSRRADVDVDYLASKTEVDRQTRQCHKFGTGFLHYPEDLRHGVPWIVTTNKVVCGPGEKNIKVTPVGSTHTFKAELAFSDPISGLVLLRPETKLKTREGEPITIWDLLSPPIYPTENVYIASGKTPTASDTVEVTKANIGDVKLWMSPPRLGSTIKIVYRSMLSPPEGVPRVKTGHGVVQDVFMDENWSFFGANPMQFSTTATQPIDVCPGAVVFDGENYIMGISVDDGRIMTIDAVQHMVYRNLGYLFKLPPVIQPGFRVETSVGNVPFRKFLKLMDDNGKDTNTEGVLVTEVYPELVTDNLSNPHLQQWDVITHVEKHKIDNNGSTVLRGKELIHWTYLVRHLYRGVDDGKSVTLTVMRKGKMTKVDYRLNIQDSNTFTNPYTYKPLFFLMGCYCFGSYLVLGGGQSCKNDVCLYKVYPHEMSKGVRLTFDCVREINDEPIFNLCDLKRFYKLEPGQGIGPNNDWLHVQMVNGRSIYIKLPILKNTTEEVMIKQNISKAHNLPDDVKHRGPRAVGDAAYSNLANLLKGYHAYYTRVQELMHKHQSDPAPDRARVVVEFEEWFPVINASGNTIAQQREQFHKDLNKALGDFPEARAELKESMKRFSEFKANIQNPARLDTVAEEP